MARSVAPLPSRASPARWLALLLHELRSPLQPLRSFVALARCRGLADADLRRGLEGAERQLDLLQRLLDDLSCLSTDRWSPQHLLREKVSLRAVVEQGVQAMAAPMAAQAQLLQLTLEGGEAWLHGDADRLLQVVVNLLSNASRYTPHGGRVHVKLQCQTERAVLTVSDSGCGLAAGEATRIFRPFERGQGAAGLPGSGLGLAIVRLFVEQHGGRVAAFSAGPGCGSCFTVSLPLAA